MAKNRIAATAPNNNHLMEDQMKHLLLPGLFSLMMVSCDSGMTKSEFSEKYVDAACQKEVSCDDEYDYTVAECIEETKPFVDLGLAQCSGFDGNYAEKCVKCVKGLTCPQWEEFTSDEPEEEYCTSCDQVCD